MKVKIYGAGSIGNHLAQASRRIGWDVTVVDKDLEALKRMEFDIYPTRYDSWDSAIELFEFGKEPKGDFDMIFLGTPPDVRMRLASEVLIEEPKVILLEKPLCTPDCTGLKKFADECEKGSILAFVGYDHAVSESVEFVKSLLNKNTAGTVQTIDVEFREHWAGIFGAHPWLSGPADTYLGFTKRGGGASGEHSHALHLWNTFAHAACFGKVTDVASHLHMVAKDNALYDDIATFTLKTESGAIGRVVQDVVTKPPRKWARIQGDSGFVEWVCGGGSNGADLVRWLAGDDEQVKEFSKTRPDDFYQEMVHIHEVFEGNIDITDSPIRLETGIAVMKILATAQNSSMQPVVSLN